MSTLRDSSIAACNGNRSKFQQAKFCEANCNSAHLAAVTIVDSITHPLSCSVFPDFIMPTIKAWENTTAQASVMNPVASGLTSTPSGRLSWATFFGSPVDTRSLTPATLKAFNGNFTSCKDEMDVWQLWEILKKKNNHSWKKKKRSIRYLNFSAAFDYTPSLHLLQGG